jgi:hypothetical protein
VGTIDLGHRLILLSTVSNVSPTKFRRRLHLGSFELPILDAQRSMKRLSELARVTPRTVLSLQQSVVGGAGAQKGALWNVLPTSRRQGQASSAGKMPAAR